MDTCNMSIGMSCPSKLERPTVTGASESTGAIEKQRMNLVVVGHVDHGKSTVVGRLLADTDSLPEGKLEQARAKCEAAGKRFEYAFLLDALMDEQAQGITIDTARIFFRTEKRHYIILDAPGHIEFLRNMVTGASHAEAALLVIDAEEGVRENSRRHGYMLSMLGVKHLIVLINKMDLVAYSESAYTALVQEYSDFLASVGSRADLFIPISGLEGANVAQRSAEMSWYKGPTVLEALDEIRPVNELQNETLRMYVQDVYKFTKYGDSRRIIAGTIDSGTLSVGDEIVLYPSGKRTRVETIESFNTPPLSSVGAGEAVGFTMSEQIYVNRGEIITRDNDAKPAVSTLAKVSLFWLGAEPLSMSDDFIVKIGTARVPARIESITKVIDAGELTQAENVTEIGRNSVAECVLRFAKPLAFDDVAFLSETSRFVIVHRYRIWGGGIVREALSDNRATFRQQAISRDEKWIRSLVSPLERAERYAQRPMLLVVTGPKSAPRKELGKLVEARLFTEGRVVYFLGLGSIVYGLDSDLEGADDIGQEHIRRLAELGNIMLDAGLMLVVSAAELKPDDISLVQELVGADRVRVAMFDAGPSSAGDIALSTSDSLEDNLRTVKAALAHDRFIFALS